MTVSSTALSYETLVEAFNVSLVDTLRSHGADLDYLSLWVPDADPVKSIHNMLDAAIEGGRSELSVSIRRSTLAGISPADLDAALGDVCRLAVKETETGYLLLATELHRAHRGISAIADAQARERLEQVNYVYGESHAAQMPQIFQQVAREFAAQPRFGRLPEAGGQVSAIEASDSGTIVRLLMNGEDQTVATIGYQSAGGPLLIGLLEAFCRVSLGMPAREVGEHSINKILYLLRDTAKHRPTQGILLPFNGGPEFALLHKLARQLNAEVRAAQVAAGDAVVGVNFYDAAPAPVWLSLTGDERLAAVRAAAATLLAERQLPADGIHVAELDNDLSDWPVRVNVELGDAIPVARRPGLIRDFELHLKKRVENKLQVYYVERKDMNKIRRL